MTVAAKTWKIQPLPCVALLDQDGLTQRLPEATARGRSVISGGVFNSGLLTAPRPGATYFVRVGEPGGPSTPPR